jgi:hypothetical protein
MKSKFQNLNFDSVEVLSREQSARVKGGAYGAGGGVSYLSPPSIYIDPPPPTPCFRWLNPLDGTFTNNWDADHTVLAPC